MTDFIVFFSCFAGPILVDTVNLSASAGKATAKDITMVEELSKLCPDLDKDKMYQELQEAKADISGKNTPDFFICFYIYFYERSPKISCFFMWAFSLLISVLLTVFVAPVGLHVYVWVGFETLHMERFAVTPCYDYL